LSLKMLPPDTSRNHRDRGALDAMMPVLYGELRRMAQAHFQREREGHTLQPTALVHEAYLRLLGQQDVDWHNRPQFLGIAARIMRRVLVDYWSRHNAQKRLEGGQRVPLEDFCRITAGPSVDFIDLDRALVELARVDTQQAEIVELRFFGGLTIDEVAGLQGLSTATVEREWSTARLWLARHLAGAPPV
jgi:RNA polymerase sigma factor (TIGR02999 family)